MIGQMTKYKEYIEKNYEPIDSTQLSYYVDMRGLRDYAKIKGVPIVELSEKEKSKFLIKKEVTQAMNL